VFRSVREQVACKGRITCYIITIITIIIIIAIISRDSQGLCAVGARGVAVVDPTDGLDKLFVYGGRRVAGGRARREAAASAAWLYDPQARAWEALDARSAGSRPPDRVGHSLACEIDE
jgi:hypothetical protein